MHFTAHKSIHKMDDVIYSMQGSKFLNGYHQRTHVHTTYSGNIFGPTDEVWIHKPILEPDK